MSLDDDLSPESFEDLPSTDIDVRVHVHFGMTGSFPLRLADLFFADDGVHVAEYAYITPMFGLGTRKHRREAAAMQRIYDVHGVDEVLLQADRVTWHSYENIERVVLYEGGLVGRPKVALYPHRGQSQAYRFHDDLDTESVARDLTAIAADHEFSFDHVRGLGFDPIESVRRFVGPQ